MPKNRFISIAALTLLASISLISCSSGQVNTGTTDLTTKTASTGNEQSYIGRAHSAPGISQCLSAASGPGTEIDAAVETTAICFAGGDLKKVTFYSNPRCNGNQVCSKRASIIVATVEFGCNGEITSAQCSQGSQ